MNRSLLITVLAFATFAMLGDETRGETADDVFLRNILPDVSCSTTVVVKNEDPGELHYSEYQTKICENFQNKFNEAYRELTDLPKNSSIDIEKFFEEWTRITASLCRKIMAKEKLVPVDHACLFGVPPKEQPIARAMYALYLKGKLPDSYSHGSWCTTTARQENNLQKIAVLKEIFGDTDDANAWGSSQRKLLNEGFQLTPGRDGYYRALGTSSSDGSSEDWVSLPFPMFNVYFGQERMPQQGELCMKGDTLCGEKSIKAKVQDGICLTWVGFGP